MYDSKSGFPLMRMAGEYPVVDGNTVYFSGKTVVVKYGGDKPGGREAAQEETPAQKPAAKSEPVDFMPEMDADTLAYYAGEIDNDEWESV